MNIRARLEAVEKKMNEKPTFPTSDCLMKDGSTQRFYGLTVVQPFLDGEITSLTTNDADVAALLRAMDDTIKIDVKEF